MSGPICAVCGQHGDRPLFDHTEHFGHAFEPAIAASKVRALADTWERTNDGLKVVWMHTPSALAFEAVQMAKEGCARELRALLRDAQETKP